MNEVLVTPLRRVAIKVTKKVSKNENIKRLKYIEICSRTRTRELWPRGLFTKSHVLSSFFFLLRTLKVNDLLVTLPLHIDVKISQVVTLGYSEFLSGRVTLLFSAFWTEKDGGH